MLKKKPSLLFFKLKKINFIDNLKSNSQFYYFDPACICTGICAWKHPLAIIFFVSIETLLGICWGLDYVP